MVLHHHSGHHDLGAQFHQESRGALLLDRIQSAAFLNPTKRRGVCALDATGHLHHSSTSLCRSGSYFPQTKIRSRRWGCLRRQDYQAIATSISISPTSARPHSLSSPGGTLTMRSPKLSSSYGLDVIRIFLVLHECLVRLRGWSHGLYPC